MSGAFGIGATAFIQISLMLFFGVSLYHAIGTTMLVILPISVSGGLGYLVNGHLDFYIFLQTLGGLTIGAYLVPSLRVWFAQYFALYCSQYADHRRTDAFI